MLTPDEKRAKELSDKVNTLRKFQTKKTTKPKAVSLSSLKENYTKPKDPEIVTRKEIIAEPIENIIAKMNNMEGVIESKVIKDVPTLDQVVQHIKNLKGNDRIDKSNIRNLDMGDMRWHGAGLANITGLLTQGTNVTITGSGTSSDPYVISATGGSTSPGGISGQVQYNLSGAFAGITGATVLAGKMILQAGRANGTFSPQANDSAQLGSTVTGWGDLFLAEGGVIDWDNGDVTITQNNNDLSFDGANTYRFNGQVNIQGNASLTLEDPGAGTNIVALVVPSGLAASYTLTLPVDTGTTGQVLTTNGGGTLSWTTITPGTGTVTSVATGTGLTGGTITATGTIALSTALAPMATLTGNSLKVLRVNVGETAVEYATASTGDFVGPGSATDNAIVRFDGTTGKLGQNSGIIIGDISSNNITINTSSANPSTQLTIRAGSGLSGNTQGGNLKLFGGDAAGTADGGAIFIQGGTATDATTTAGGTSVQGGNNASGNGGTSGLIGGSTSAGTGVGGAVYLAGGKSFGGTNGDIRFYKDSTLPSTYASFDLSLIATTAKTYSFLNATGNIPSVAGHARLTGQTGAASLTTYTVPNVDSSYLISANILITTATLHSFTCTCTYTDESNTSRTLTLNFSTVAGVLTPTVVNTNGAIAYEGVPLHIRAKASTTIIIATTGTFTTVAYNFEEMITQIN